MKSSPLHEAARYLTFVATALALLLPGAVLPQLLSRWSLNDRQGGVLLFVFFAGSSLSAFAARGRLQLCVVTGCGTTGAGLLAMRAWSSAGAMLAVLLVGAGVGLTMTSISVLQSRLRAARRAAELARLNLGWSLGACAAPFLLLASSGHFGVGLLLASMAAAFLVLGVCNAFGLREAEPLLDRQESHPSIARRRFPWLLLLLLPLVTGVEASLGGWLSTFGSRQGLRPGGVAATLTCFWLGLLLSRLAQSFTKVAAGSQAVVLRCSAPLLVAGIALLLLRPHGIALGLGSLTAGFALGPLYPLGLALWLERSRGSTIGFFVAGLGSSVIPLLTGLVSAAAHSLGRGLLVPLAAALAMLLLTARIRQFDPAGTVSPVL